MKYLNSLMKDYIPQLSFKCSGILFKDIDNFGTNYTYIFPECRTDTKILNKGKNGEEEDENTDFMSMLESECTVVKYNKEDKECIILSSYCIFLVKATYMSDIYELYCKSSSGNMEKHSYASIPSMECSKMMRKLFNENKEGIIMKCTYNKIFKKWIPMEESKDNIDNLHKINKVKLYVENIEEEEI